MKPHIIIYLIACIALVGCTEMYDESNDFTPALMPRYISISSNSLTFPSSNSTKSLQVNSIQTPWSFHNAIDWMSLSPESGDNSSEVTVSATENTSGSSVRTGIFYLKSSASDWECEIPIAVTQEKAAPLITLSKSLVEFTGAENTETIEVTSNYNWSVSSSATWLSATKTGNTIVISAVSNETDVHRTAYVYIFGSSKTPKITVEQAPASITASTETLTFNNAANSVDVTITSEASWTASTSNSWIEISPDSGTSGVSTMTVSIAPNTSINERTGYVMLSIGEKQKIQIPIKQDGVYIRVDKEDITFAASGETHSINISSNTTWTVSDCPSWISVSQDSGNGDATVNITAENNASTSSRSASIKVIQEGLSIDNTIVITQNGKTLDISAQKLTFEDTEETKSINIWADDSWSIENSNSWISVSPTSGSGSSSVEITVEENETESKRKGTIYITMLDKTIDVTISQDAKVFSIDIENKSLTFTAAGGDQTLNITSNTYWTLSDVPLWVTLSTTNGKGDASVVVTAEENMSLEERSGEMFLSIDGKEEKTTITLTQSGKIFNLSSTPITFSDKSESQSVTIETDGEWSATTNDSWITLSPPTAFGSSTLTVTVEENKTDKERNGNIAITMGEKTLYVSVKQKGKFLTIANSLLTYNSKGGEIDITITTNDTWTAKIEDEASWLQLSQTNGTGTVNLKAIAADNPSVNSRTASIIVETPHTQGFKIVVHQEARYLNIDTKEVLFYAKGGTSEVITVSTDGTYEITCSDSWFSVTQSSNTFTVTATENTAFDARSGTITIALTDLKDESYILTLTVKQLNKGNTFLKQEYETDTDFDNNGNSTVNLTITTFDSDKNYDNTNSNGVTLSIFNFKNDTDWDAQTSSGITLTITEYKTDKNYDNTNSSGVTLSISNFKSDTDWDAQTSSGITLTITGYKTDKNYD